MTRSLGDLVRLEEASVHLVLGTSSPSPRFRVWIDDRAIKAGGCAPDLFWIAVRTGKPVHVDTSCRATGTPIRVELGPAGVAAVEPETTVVAVVHPGMQPELMDTIATTIDSTMDARTAGTIGRTVSAEEDFCYHQPFFAAPEAATEWRAAHPGGQLFTVAEFLAFWRWVTRETLAKANVDIL